MVQLILFDIRPDPVPVAGIGGLILLAFLILFLSATVLIAIVVVVKRMRRKQIQRAQTEH